MKFDIAFSLNRQIDIEADTWEEAEDILLAKLAEEGIDLSKTYNIEIFDVNEEEV